MQGFINQLIRDGSTELLNAYRQLIPPFTELLAQPEVHINTYKLICKKWDKIPFNVDPVTVQKMLSSRVFDVCDVPLSIFIRSSALVTYLTNHCPQSEAICALIDNYAHISKLTPGYEVFTTARDIYTSLAMYCNDLECAKYALRRLILDFELNKLSSLITEQTTIETVTAMLEIIDELGLDKTSSYESVLLGAITKGNLSLVQNLLATVALSPATVTDVADNLNIRGAAFTVLKWLIGSKHMHFKQSKLSLEMIIELKLTRKWILGRCTGSDKKLINFTFEVLSAITKTQCKIKPRFTADPNSLLAAICKYAPDVKLAKKATMLGASGWMYDANALTYACKNKHRHLVEYLMSINYSRIDSHAVTDDSDFTMWAFSRWRFMIIQNDRYNTYYKLILHSYLQLILKEIIMDGSNIIHILSAGSTYGLLSRRPNIYALLASVNSRSHRPAVRTKHVKVRRWSIRRTSEVKPNHYNPILSLM